MAGILDSTAMKLLFGGTQHMRDREEARRSQAVQGLIGTPEQYPGGGKYSGPPTPGTGLLGNNPTMPQFQAAAGPQLLGMPGYQGIGGTMVNQAAAGERSMANAELNRQFQQDQD